jgi:CBS domain-containing protein
MIQGHIHRVIIVDSDFHPIGIVTALDLLRLAYPAGASAGD